MTNDIYLQNVVHQNRHRIATVFGNFEKHYLVNYLYLKERNKKS